MNKIMKSKKFILLAILSASTLAITSNDQKSEWVAAETNHLEATKTEHLSQQTTKNAPTKTNKDLNEGYETRSDFEERQRREALQQRQQHQGLSQTKKNVTFTNCFNISDYNDCNFCYQSLQMGPQGCLGQLPDSFNCLMTNYANSCHRCKPGYGLVYTPFYGHTCQPTNLDNNCQIAFGSPKFDFYTCDTCKDGYYVDSTNRGCVKAEDVQVKVENCLWGGFLVNGVRLCRRCQSGYVLNANRTACLGQERDVNDKCLIYDFVKKKCISCDVYNGFSAQLNFTCQ